MRATTWCQKQESHQRGLCATRLASRWTLLVVAASLSPAHALSLRILSWNVLAPLYAPRAKYPWSHPSHLKWDYRKDLIARQILHEDADLVCLQEVQLDCWEDLYRHNVTATPSPSSAAPPMESSSPTSLYALYDCVLQNVTRGHGVALALLVRRTSGLSIRAVESRSRALIAVLQLRLHQNLSSSSRPPTPHHSPPPLFLANVHLEAGMGPDEDATRFCQLQSLMKHLDKHIRASEQRQQQETGSSGGNNRDRCDPAIVIVGDWNMRSDNPMYHLVSTGRLPDSDDERTASSSSSSDRRRRLLRLPLPHLPLRDAYRLVPSHEVACTYSGGSVLDYLWVSSSVHVERLGSKKPDSQHARRHFWPNHLHPSDHLALGATLRIVDGE